MALLTSRTRRILLGLGAAVLVLLAFGTWYDLRYSMDEARSFEVGDTGADSRVLVATQGSGFKGAVVAGVVEHLRGRAAYVKVIDVSELSDVDASDWHAIVILHTWEMREPQADAKAFVDRAPDRRRIVVLGTSGEGSFRMEGVDAISTASTLADVPARVAEITARVDAILTIS